jgi:hypothetical protein
MPTSLPRPPPECNLFHAYGSVSDGWSTVTKIPFLLRRLSCGLTSGLEGR